MFINEYKIVKPTIDRGEYKALKDLNGQDINRYAINKLGPIKTKGDKTALLYLGGGYSLDDNETYLTDTTKFQSEIPAIPDTPIYKRSLISRIANWIRNIEGNICYTDIVSNTCATGVYAIEKAKYLLDTNKVDEVLIIGEVKINYTVLRLFKEYRIPITISEGLVFIRLSRKGKIKVSDIKTYYEFNSNPFAVSSKAYREVLTEADIIKPHSTFTEVNTEAEDFLNEYNQVITYKQEIGHTLSISSLLEACMLIDDKYLKDNKSALIVASGLGGFYGSFKIQIEDK